MSQSPPDRVILKTVIEDPTVQSLLDATDSAMGALGYTEHGRRHAKMTANGARRILADLGHEERIAELAAIAGYLHDIGNLINRENHALTGALMAQDILKRLGMGEEELFQVMGAIGNHQEENGSPISATSAALILADKIDVHRGRVRGRRVIEFDKHDRVNYSVDRSIIHIDSGKKVITYDLSIDTELSQVMEYFEIFMSRMVISRRSAAFLKCKLAMIINGAKLL